MRLTPVIAVFDKKTGLFDPPFTVRHNGEAVREFGIVKKNPETKFGKNPEDFELFQIGNYNDTLGTFENLTQHVHLDSGI
ncbi:MAG: hypothetical protein [Arizlama microvirus]|nr:MAG: hypothetical protein [Arizlama microvirus]